jgi:hypothetical protein
MLLNISFHLASYQPCFDKIRRSTAYEKHESDQKADGDAPLLEGVVEMLT